MEKAHFLLTLVSLLVTAVASVRAGAVFPPSSRAPCVDGGHCLNGGTCDADDVTGDETCTCPAGFVGAHCQCIGVGPDPCLAALCQENAECVWDCVDYFCRCENGFQQTGDGKCVDVNECALGTDLCATNFECLNLIGSYECICPDGFELVGDDCKRICPTGWSNYGAYCYYFPNLRLNPDQAREICHSHGTDLVCSLSGSEELLFLAKITKGVSWLGYNDTEEEGKYKCVWDPNDFFPGRPQPADWVVGEPNGTVDENCLTLVHYGWASVPCSEPHRFVCELDVGESEACPDGGWVHFESLGADSCYWNSSNEVAFYSADQFCQILYPGAHLFIIDSDEENLEVAARSDFLSGSGPVYIGYSQKSGTTTWSWVNPGSGTLFRNWLDGQPTNNPQQQECAVLVPSHLSDVACELEYPFACKSLPPEPRN